MTTLAETATLVHGYTLADVEKITRQAYTSTRRLVLDSDDRWDAAWFGVVERLYDTELDSPTHQELFDAGTLAVQTAARANLQAHGISSRTKQTAPKFIRYWGRPGDHDEGFAERLIERLALPQVLGQLTDLEYEALSTLAVYGDQATAATALGVPRKILNNRLRAARKRLLSVWFEHETPRAMLDTSNPDNCGHGHSKAEHGYHNGRHWICRLCKRNSMRRLNARLR